jgi:hypothetical protein
MLEDFYHTGKIQRLGPGLNPRTRVPEASMLTTRPPKPSLYLYIIIIIIIIITTIIISSWKKECGQRML